MLNEEITPIDQLIEWLQINHYPNGFISRIKTR